MQRSFEDWLREKPLSEGAGTDESRPSGAAGNAELLGLPVVPAGNAPVFPVVSPDRTLEEIPEEIPEETPEETSEKIPGEVPEETSEEPSEKPQEKIPEEFPENADSMPLPEKPAERTDEAVVPEEIVPQSPESVPSDVPAGFPETGEISPTTAGETTGEADIREIPLAGALEEVPLSGEQEIPVRRYIPPQDVVSDVEQQLLAEIDETGEREARRKRRVVFGALIFCAVAALGFWWGTRTTPAELNDRGVLLLDSGKSEDALRLFRKAESKSPDSLPIQLNIAKSLERLGRHGDAVDAYFRCLQIAPSDPEIHLRLGSLFRTLESPEKAVRSFQDVLQRDPGNARALLGLGLSYLDRADAVQAVPVLERAIERDADLQEAKTALEKAKGILEEQKRLQEAQKARERAAEALERGRVAQMLNRDEEAESCFEEALRFDPDSEAAQLSLANVLKKAGKYPRARELYENVLMKSPEQQEARLGLLETLKLEASGERPVSGDATMQNKPGDAQTEKSGAEKAPSGTSKPGRKRSSPSRRSSSSSSPGEPKGIVSQARRAAATVRRTDPVSLSRTRDPLENLLEGRPTETATTERPTFRPFPFPLGEYAVRRLSLPDSVLFRTSPVLFPYIMAVSSLQQAVSVNPDGQDLYLAIVRYRRKSGARQDPGVLSGYLSPEEEGLYSLLLAHALYRTGSGGQAGDVLKDARRFMPNDPECRRVVRFLSGI